MATNANLPPGAFLTTIGGKKCTAVPLKKNDVTTSTSTSASTSTSTAQVMTTSSITTTTTASSQATTTVELTTSLVTSTTATVVAPPPPPETTTVLQSTTTAITTTAPASTTSTSTSTIATTTSVATTQTQVSPPEAQVPPPTTRTTTEASTSTTLDTRVSSTTLGTQTSTAQTTTTPPVAAIPAPSQGTTTSQLTQPGNTQDPVQAPGTSTETAISGTTTTADGSATTTAAAPDVGTSTTTSQATTVVSTNSDGALVPLPVTSPTSNGLTATVSPDSTETVGAANPVTTTNDAGVVVTETPTAGNRPQETALASTAGSGGMTPETTAAVAGGVAGSVLVLALLAFLFCWRRRRRKNNGSVPSTPTSLERSPREKEPYVIMRSSIGPTPATEKLKATLHYRYKQACLQVTEFGLRAAETVGLRKRSDVDLDRGLSQYGPLMAGGHSRSNSGVLLPPPNQPPKREYPDWWDRLTEDGENWHIKPEDSAAPSRTGSIPIGIQGLPSAATMTAAAPPPARNTSKGDKMQQTKQGDLGTARGGQPREGAPSDHFLSNLGLHIDNSDPFSDVNSMSHVSAMVMPLAAPTEQKENPFSDANAISKSAASRGPSNYVQGVQHARKESYGAMLAGKQTESIYRDRESTYSQESFQTRRNRVKSDPFDLDRLVSPLNNPLPSNTAGAARAPATANREVHQPEAPRRAHVRRPSTTSSKYSSGVQSEAGWSDPGPDVGPSVARKGSQGSFGSIGKAK